MPVIVKIDPNVTQPQGVVIPDATSTSDGVMTAAMVQKLASLSPGGGGFGAVIYWDTPSTPWSQILAQIPDYDTGQGAIILVDGGGGGDFVIDSPANLDNVLFYGDDGPGRAGNNAVSIRFDDPFRMRWGSRVNGINVNFKCNTSAPIYDGAGPVWLIADGGGFFNNSSTPIVQASGTAILALSKGAIESANGGAPIIGLTDDGANCFLFTTSAALLLGEVAAPVAPATSGNAETFYDATITIEAGTLFDPSISVSETISGIATSFITVPQGLSGVGTIEVDCQLIDVFGRNDQQAIPVLIETFAPSVGKGQITTVSGTEQMNTGAPAGQTSAAVIVTNADGTFSFSVADSSAEKVLVRVTRQGSSVATSNLNFESI